MKRAPAAAILVVRPVGHDQHLGFIVNRPSSADGAFSTAANRPSPCSVE